MFLQAFAGVVNFLGRKWGVRRTEWGEAERGCLTVLVPFTLSEIKAITDYFLSWEPARNTTALTEGK